MVSDFLELLSGQGFSPCIGNAGEVMFNPPKVLFFYRKALPEQPWEEGCCLQRKNK